MSLFSRRIPAIFPLIVLFAAQQHAEAKPMFAVPVLSSFNGSQWGDLQLGRTSFKDIRDHYETGKGAYAESTELTEPKGSPVRVDLLWVKQGDSEILHAITVRFNGTPPLLADVAKLYDPDGTTGVPFYQKGRFEDWRTLSFPGKGVAAFTMREGDVESADVVLLTSPPSLDAISRQLTGDVTPVQQRIDPHEGEPKRMDFDQITVDVDLSDNLHLPYGEKQRTIEEIEDATAGDTMRFRTHGDGTYKLKVTGNDHGKKGGTLSVSVSITGSGPYGAISSEGSDTESWSWSSRERDDSAWQDTGALQHKIRDTYRTAVDSARKTAEDSFAKQMVQSGPTPLWAVREAQWSDVADAVRSWTPVVDVPNSIVK